MEETENKSKKLSYDDLEKVAVQLQQRVAIAENKLKTIDFAALRLNWLFKVVENSSSFSPEFCTQCVKEIQEIMTIEEDTPKEEESK